jgi:uncharacterized protein
MSAKIRGLTAPNPAIASARNVVDSFRTAKCFYLTNLESGPAPTAPFISVQSRAKSDVRGIVRDEFVDNWDGSCSIRWREGWVVYSIRVRSKGLGRQRDVHIMRDKFAGAFAGPGYPPQRVSRRGNFASTFVGLAIALFALPVFMAAYRAITGQNHSNGLVLGRELAVFGIVGLLLLIVKQWELLPLGSIGLRVTRLRTSLLRGFGIAVILLAVTVALYLLLRALGVQLGKEGNVFHPSLLVVTVSMLRAGVAEEVFYRGFAIERLQSLTGSKLFAALVSLTIFALSHYQQGIGGIVVAFVLGGILTIVYMKYRDLLANITAHFLADFVLNVALPLVTGG